MSIESQIINQLIHNEEYAQTVFPYLSHSHFADAGAKTLFAHIATFVASYNAFPSATALELSLDGAKLDDSVHKSAQLVLAEAKDNKPVDLRWMIDTTETYVKDRAMNNALRASIAILDDEKKNNGEIQQLMTDALAISFDNTIGHDYIEDAEKRYDIKHTKNYKVPFSVDKLNQATKGGIERKTINVIMAGCVHPHTKVDVKYEHDGVSRVRTVGISVVKQLLEFYPEVYIAAPTLESKMFDTTFERISEYVEKGIFEEYMISTDDAVFLRCNEDHLIYTFTGWMTAKELAGLTSARFQQLHILTDKGWTKASCKPTGFMIPIVDIVVDSEQHAYFAEGIVSHNTNVGKSLILCNEAAFQITQGNNVLYITMEMSEEKVGDRVDANLINVSLDDFESMPKEWFMKALEKVKKKITGKLIIKEYPSNSAHVGHFRHLLQELRVKKGFIPDLIIVDYLNICSSSIKSGSERRDLYVKSIAEELRALSQEYGPPILTATQTNREGFDAAEASLSHTSEAWGVPLTADWFLIVTQPEELVQLGQFACKQEKSRYADKNKMRKFIIGVDMTKQRIYDVDDQGTLYTPEAQHEEEGPKPNFFGDR